MKYLKIFYILNLLFSVNCRAAGIHLKFLGIDTSKGQMAIAIFDGRHARSFPENGEMAFFRGFVIPSSDGVRIEVPSNKKYAVSVFQDLNMDQKLNTNFLGIPKEPLGFSNNPRLLFGPPSFSKASFFVGDNWVKRSIKMKKY